MEPLSLINLLAHVVQNISGTFANGLLIFLVLRKTPKYLQTYSIFILNFAICDFFACVAAFFAQVRILSSGPGLYFVFYGPCCKLFRTWICFVGKRRLALDSSASMTFDAEMWKLHRVIPTASGSFGGGVVGYKLQYIYHAVRLAGYRLTALSEFVRRVPVEGCCDPIVTVTTPLGYVNPPFWIYNQPLIGRTEIHSVCIHLMLNYSCFQTAVSLAKDLETGIKAIINKRFGYNVASECVCGHVNIFTWNILPFILHMTLPIAPVYIVILILRKMTVSRLKSELAISEHFRRQQTRLLQVNSSYFCLLVSLSNIFGGQISGVDSIH
ncbi:unnamed protein product [Haemonchus placei]|uniref:G_PROTEIN_RECEP_F1_2 domain-containing protein n=1 Tax=Haemonchus placei TaxID=6290 RepID=A0A0N4W8A4_HAEPC|nr:unnamed protein product [Haemonchus placei]